MGQYISYLRPLPVSGEIEYPDSDGKPVGESQSHVLATFHLLAALRYLYRDVADAYVSSSTLVYYEEGNPSEFVVPDVFVVKGVSNHDRRTYKIWGEGAPPTVVFEITSKGTRIQDLANKRGLYELLGVREYFLFDPLDEYLRPRLQGFAAIDNHYQEVKVSTESTIYSAELDLTLKPDGKLLRLQSPQTGEILPTFNEAMAQREAEAERAAEAEAEVERLKAELKRLRGEE